MNREELNLVIPVGFPLGVVGSGGLLSGGPGLSVLERTVREGENPVWDPESAAYEWSSQSRIAWECNLNRVVNSI